MIRASILIKANNQKEYLEQSLPLIANQTEQNHEIILLYSGTDKSTTEFARQWGAKVIEIEPTEFSHPRALNIGAREAQGQFLVCLSGDAVPKDRWWLKNLLARFQDPNVAGTYGRHVSRQGHNPSMIDRVRFELRYRNSELTRTKFFSNANSALRKSLWEEHHFDETLTVMEDYEWSLWAQHHGYCIDYEREARVEHTHGEQYGVSRYVARIIRFQVQRREIDAHWRAWGREHDLLTLEEEHVSNGSERLTMERCPEEYHSRRTVPLRIEIQEEIPDDHLCGFCGNPTRKTFVLFEQRYSEGNEPAVAVGDIPGYGCDNCGLLAYYLPACIKAYEAALEIVREAGDETTLEQIEASIHAMRQPAY